MRHIGFASSMIAEFWVLKDGLLLVSQLGISKLLVELDAQTMVNLLHSSKPYNNSFSSLLNDCRFLLRQFQQVRISHVCWEANRCDDYLAKGGCTLDGDFVVLDKVLKSGPDRTVRLEKPRTVHLCGSFTSKNRSM